MDIFIKTRFHDVDFIFTDEMSETCAKIQTLKNTPGTCDIFPRFNITYSGNYHDKFIILSYSS